MIKLYLISIVIWFIMIYGTAWIFEDKIKENGWTDIPKSDRNPYLVGLLSAVIPIIRVVFFVSAIVMVSVPKDKFDEWIKEFEENK